MTDTQKEVATYTWINPYSLMIKVIPGAGVLEPTQNYYYYDYKESTELVVEYSKLLPQAESLVQLHYTHLMPIVTRANDIFVRSMLKPGNLRPDMLECRVIAICIVKDSENIRFVARDEILVTLENGLSEGEQWTEVIANYPVINEDKGMVPGFLQPIMSSRGNKQSTDSHDTINSLVAQMNRASESYNICRIELDKMTSEALANGTIRSHVSDKQQIITDTTDITVNNRYTVHAWNSVICDDKIMQKQIDVNQLKKQYDIAVNTLRTECEIQNNLNEFANGTILTQLVSRLQNPSSHPDDTNQMVLCFLGKYIEKCTIREAKQIGVYNPEYLKFMSGLLEKGYHILPMNIEVTVTKNIVTPNNACPSTKYCIIENQEFSYRSRLARVASIVNAESIQYCCEPVEITQTQCPTLNDNNITQLTIKYITTALLIW